MMRFRDKQFTVTLALLVASAVGFSSAQPDSQKFVLSLYLDGGYAYVINQPTNSLVIGAFETRDDQPHQKHDQMFLTSWVGLRSGGLAPTSTVKGFPQWNLAGKDLRIETPPDPSHPTSATLALPPNKAVPNACPNPSHPEFHADNNNLLFFPKITSLGKGAFNGSTVFKSKVSLKGGRLAALRTVSCWEWQDGDPQTPPQQTFVGGLGAVKYNLQFSGDKLELQVGNLDGQIHGKVTLTPQLNGDQKEIVLTLHRDTAQPLPLQYKPRPVSSVAPGSTLQEFNRFYSLLSASRTRPMPKKLGLSPASGLDTPGDECPPALFFIN